MHTIGVRIRAPSAAIMRLAARRLISEVASGAIHAKSLPGALTRRSADEAF